MRILFLTQFFDPEPFFKALPFARELVARGHNVEVLTGFPNYPGGKIYPGYKIKLVARELMHGVSIIRVPLFPSHDQSAVKRVFNYLTFALSAGVLGPFLVKQADVAYVYHPPPTVGFPAMMLRMFRGIPFVYDVQDIWPDSLEATGMLRNRTALAIVGRWCRAIYKRASAVVVLSPGFKEQLIQRGVQAEKIHVVYNWAPDEAQGDENVCDSAVDLRLSGKFNVMFAGNMGPAQALDCVLTAAQRMKDADPQVQFIFVGAGISVDSLKNRAAAEKLTNVLFLPRVSPSEAASLMQKADVLLVHLKKDPLFEITIPSKTQAYLASGKPILIGVDGDAARLVEQAGAGIAFSPESSDGLLAAIKRLRKLSPTDLAAMGENGRAFYRSKLSRSAAVTAFERVFDAVKNYRL